MSHHIFRITSSRSSSSMFHQLYTYIALKLYSSSNVETERIVFEWKEKRNVRYSALDSPIINRKYFSLINVCINMYLRK